MKCRWTSFSCFSLALLAMCLMTRPAGAGTLAFWNMKPTGIQSPCVLDGQIDEAVQNLWSQNANNNSFVTSSDVPPASMRTRPDDSGVSYNAAAITNLDGALLYPANVYGSVFNFTNTFTVEFFFKTAADKSTNGVMQLLIQGTTTLRFGFTINDPSPGDVRFTLRDSAAQLAYCDLATRNFADGQWHCLRATYDPAAGANGEMTLTILNEDRSCDFATTALTATFQPLRAGSDGNLQIGRNTYLKNQSPRTFLGLIDELQITEGLATGTNLTGAFPGPITRWSMDPTGTNFPATLDALSADGSQNLITFSGLQNNPYPASAEVPPASLCANGFSGGAYSFNAAAFTNVAGALFYPQDVYGNVFSFTGGFSVEAFFKTAGDQSGAGFMELVLQGENFFRFGLIVNEPAAGNVRFAINDGQGLIPVVDLTGRNYADGQWHYLLAKYLPQTGTKGTLTLSIANTDGTIQNAATTISSSFANLPGGNDGNLFIGRNVFALGSNSRNFIGLIDEVRISSGSPAASQRLGLSSPQPSITSTTYNGNAVTLNWAALPGETYVVEYTEDIGAQPPQWTPVSAQTPGGTSAIFTETNSIRLSKSAGFYRITLR